MKFMEKLYKIKPPEWCQEGGGTWVFKTGFGSYSVWTRDGKCYVWIAGMSYHKGCDSVDIGKQLAESDWLARISPDLAEVEAPEPDRRFSYFGAAMWKYVTDQGEGFCGEEISEYVLPLAQSAGLCCRVEYSRELHGYVDAETGDKGWWWGDHVGSPEWKGQIKPEPDRELLDALKGIIPEEMSGESKTECRDDELVTPRRITWGAIRRVRKAIAKAERRAKP